MLVRQSQCNYALWFFLLLMPCTMAYGEEPSWHTGGAAAPSADVNKKSKIVEIKRIIDAAALLETEVTLEGVFRGWKGECSSSYMLTRSDWILEDETGCIYITGRMPNGSHANKPQGERIIVQGKVVLGSAGKPVIKADKLIPVP